MSVLLIQGDARSIPLADRSVHCVVTSPPYWGLRDYGVGGQLGLEKTPDEYIRSMVEVFREVKRVLRDDGTLWLNMGDSYAGSGQGFGDRKTTNKSNGSSRGVRMGSVQGDSGHTKYQTPPPGLKCKDLVGIPWMLAFALRSDGWYLRSDIIWSKPNPMPESVTDRPTKAHEYIFLLSKSERYYYNFEASKEPVAGTAHARGDGINPKARNWKTPDGWDTTTGNGGHGTILRSGREKGHRKPDSWQRPRQNESFSAAVNGLVDSRNRRSVWHVATEPFPEAHFATFPKELIKPCILAGCPASGTVLDPFVGSGTTALVARHLQCNAVGIELNPAYLEIAKRRLAQSVLSFTT